MGQTKTIIFIRLKENSKVITYKHIEEFSVSERLFLSKHFINLDYTEDKMHYNS